MDNDDITLEISNILTDITVNDNVQVGDIYIDTSTMNTNVYTIDNTWISIGDITEDTIDISSISINIPVEFEDTMPDVAKVEDMCNDYPGLRKAYENFKAVYKMVHQDWQGRQDAEDQLF